MIMIVTMFLLTIFLLSFVARTMAGPILCSTCTAWAVTYCTGGAPACGPWAAICWGVCTSAAVASCLTTCIAPTP